MSDRYNSKIAGIIGRLNGIKLSDGFAVTISATTTLYSVSEAEVSPGWRKHEDTHKAQIKARGWWEFMIKYFIRIKNEGYYENKFEIEARGKK